ncbi:MAG: NapC/NirT family cytochrome c [Planctomycetes bacterium]|nr:NapC/NirT family cytochrome c [Planctomycetota bacterium]
MMNENDPTTAPQSPAEEPVETPEPAPRSLRDDIKLWFLRAAALGGAFGLMVGLMTAVSAMYTSRPEFCRSCHNMEPYYESWQNSSHKDVSCVKCHFPPGAGEKLRGKMLGLVQLAKYVTSSEGPRPAAEVPDASCLRSGCHESRLLAGRVEFQGVAFDHRPHLGEMRRGKKLRCTSCHSQIVQGSHMTVTTSTCFLCHFKDGHLNEGLGACTRCHQIPEEEFDLGGGITFDHDLAYERGVDCANCHADLIRGRGEVPRERCGVCHNRTDDLERIDDHEFLHRKHVTDHKVDCLECHLEIHHSLDEHRIRHAASDCNSCHPEHHQEQVNMLMGVGGKSIPERTNGMTDARISCPSCHQVKEISATGTVLWKASTKMCANCHDGSAMDMITSQHEGLKAALSDIESCIGRVRQAVESADLGAERAATLTAELDQFNDDLAFLRAGNGIHNIHYAGTLTRALVDGLSALCRELKISGPTVVLPERVESPQ